MPDVFRKLISKRNESIHFRLNQLIERHMQIWNNSSESDPGYLRHYNRNERERNRIQFELFFQKYHHLFKKLVTNNLFQIDYLNGSWDSCLKDIVIILEKANISLGIDDIKSYLGSSISFLEFIKKYDETIEINRVYQAIRNVWIINSLQQYMGLPVACTGPAYAYSMLYPYSDNILDDNDIQAQMKFSFNSDFKHILQGDMDVVTDPLLNKIRKCISLIENTFPRVSFPLVYESLLTIYNSQILSLLQRDECTSSDILKISLAKGGSSVIADGYLINGTLNDGEFEFCFGFGAFLQFLDDLQDVKTDKLDDHCTIFTSCLDSEYLDARANQLFSYMYKIVDTYLVDSELQTLRNLILNNCSIIILESIYRNREFFSNSYIERMQPFFPLNFLDYNKMVVTINKQILSHMKGKLGVGHLLRLFKFLSAILKKNY